MIIFTLLLNAATPANACDRKIFIRVWEATRTAKAAVGGPLRVYTQGSHLIPESELKKATQAVTTEIPELMKRLQVGDLIYKAHYYGDKLFLTPNDRARLKQAGISEVRLVELAKEHTGRTFLDYDELRQEWESALSTKRKQLLKTFALAPLHLARILLLIPDVVTAYKIKTLEKRLLENPDHEFQPPKSLLGRLFFDEKAYAQKIINLKALREEIRANPHLYQNAAQLQQAITVAMRLLVMAAILSMKFGYDDKTLKESFDLDDPDGMHRNDAENGIVELIYYPDAREVAIRIGPKVYHYEWNSMVRVDSLPLYAANAKGKGDHVRVQLKMSQDEILKLKERLEDERNRIFLGVAPYNTAAGKANQDLRAATGIGVLPILDRTHATALPTLQLRNFFESTGLTQDRVHRIIYASDEGKGRDLLGLATDGVEAAYVRSLPWKSLVILPLVEQLPQGKRDESKIVKRAVKSEEQYIEEVKTRALKVKTWDDYFKALEDHPDPLSIRILNTVFSIDEANRLEADADETSKK